jgi:tetratricopeptide (TPR) repeat protein
MTSASTLHPIEIGALVALVNQERLNEAEQRTRAMLRMHPDAGILWKILSVALARQGRDALQALRRTAELMPQDAEAHCNLGAALHDRGQWAEALESLRRALAIQPDNAETLVDAANALRALRRAREALPLYRRALELDPRHVEARNNLGNALLELRQYDDAVAWYRLALQSKPDDAQILCNLANAQRQLGLLSDAIASVQRAVALEPASSIAHNALGLVLSTMGRRKQAIASLSQALTLNPNNIDALVNLGNVLRDQGLRREAVAFYRRAIELDPGRADSHCNLGTALFEFRRVDEAVASYRQALSLDPEYAPAHMSLAVALRQQRRPADAETSCRAALAIDPHYADALALLGELRADRGQFAEAEQLFQQAIASNPDISIAYASIATHRKMTDADGAWLAETQALLGKALPLAQQIGLRYALGKYFDDLRQYEQAFEHYRQANELTKRYGLKYDRAKLTERIERIMRDFDAASVQRGGPQACSSQLPVFIVGMPRSGTSLAEQILASHPAVYGAGELMFWNTAYDTFREAQLAGSDASSLMPAMAADYLARLTALSPGALRVVDKLPANFMSLGMIHEALPNARIIHMQRHPIDTCLSIYFQNFFSIGPYANDLDNLAHYYGEYIRITDHWRAVLPATSLLEVPYEALVEDQEGWSRRMLDFIGLPWDPRCLDFDQTDRVVITASKWQVRQKISKSSVARWRNYERFVGPLLGLLQPGPDARHSWTPASPLARLQP